jgi:hypothetical protein
LEALASVSKLATNLKKVREVAAIEDVTDYLDDVVKATEAERKLVAPQAAKANAAEKHKPDFAKIKALLTEVRQINKLPPASGAGPAGAKGARDMPCNDLKEEADEKFIILDAGTVAAIGVTIELATAEAAATVALQDAARRRIALAALAAIALFLSKYHDYIEAQNRWEACLRAHKLDLATFVGTQLKRARELRDRVLRARDEIQRWVQMFPSL